MEPEMTTETATETQTPFVSLALALQLGHVAAAGMDESAGRLLSMVQNWIPLHAQAHGLTIDQVYAMGAREALEGITATTLSIKLLPESLMQFAFNELTESLGVMAAALNPEPNAEAGE